MASWRLTRTTRLSTDAGNSAIVTHGKSHEVKPLTPKVGSQPSITENTMTSNAATKKFGVDAPTSENA